MWGCWISVAFLSLKSCSGWNAAVQSSSLQCSRTTCPRGFGATLPYRCSISPLQLFSSKLEWKAGRLKAPGRQHAELARSAQIFTPSQGSTLISLWWWWRHVGLCHRKVWVCSEVPELLCTPSSGLGRGSAWSCSPPPPPAPLPAILNKCKLKPSVGLVHSLPSCNWCYWIFMQHITPWAMSSTILLSNCISCHLCHI